LTNIFVADHNEMVGSALYRMLKSHLNLMGLQSFYSQYLSYAGNTNVTRKLKFLDKMQLIASRCQKLSKIHLAWFCSNSFMLVMLIYLFH